MRVYLDNCCYNRPYDDQTSTTISLETQAKLKIQELIKNQKIELVTSYILAYENNANPFEIRRNTISEFINENETVFVSVNSAETVEARVKEIMSTGIKFKDACHVASAIFAGADYFISYFYRLQIVKYVTDDIKIMNPLDFIREMEE